MMYDLNFLSKQKEIYKIIRNIITKKNQEYIFMSYVLTIFAVIIGGFIVVSLMMQFLSRNLPQK